MILEGMFWCAIKGVYAVTFRRPKRKKRRWMGNAFGWSGKMIDNKGRDIWKEQKTRPRGGRSHHLTDLIVEWNRLNPERGAKLMCGLILTGMVFAYAAGLLS